MKIERQNKAAKFWDKVAANYDKEERKDQKIYDQILQKTKIQLKPSDTVLDFGCGTGFISIEIASSVSIVHAIDLSGKMIEFAKLKATTVKLPNIEYRQITIFDNKLSKGAFDIILAFYILHLVEDIPVVIQRIKELLKPGGIFISATPCMGEKPLLNSLFSISAKIGILPEIRSFKRYELEQLLTAANLEIAESEKLATTSNQYLIMAQNNR